MSCLWNDNLYKVSLWGHSYITLTAGAPAFWSASASGSPGIFDDQGPRLSNHQVLGHTNATALHLGSVETRSLGGFTFFPESAADMASELPLSIAGEIPENFFFDLLELHLLSCAGSSAGSYVPNIGSGPCKAAIRATPYPILISSKLVFISSYQF